MNFRTLWDNFSLMSGRMKIVQIPVLKDNYTYLLICAETGQAAVVDSPEAAPVLLAAEREGVDLVAILNTHHHGDHVGANQELLANRDLEVFGHVSDRDRIPGMTRGLEEGDRVTVGRLTSRVLFVPGHTRAHIAYLFDDVMFCGDTVFVGGCGRLFEGTPEQMYHSLNRKISALSDETRMYCAHEYTEKNLSFALTLEPGNRLLQEKMQRVREARSRGESTVPSTLGEEKSYNPFFRCDSPEIYENLSKKAGNVPKDPVAVFTRVRELKDRF